MYFPQNLGLAIENLHTKGAFLTVADENKTNTMTIGWGEMGFAWGSEIISVMVRQTRFTKEILDKTMEFTVSIPGDDSFKDALAFCGSKSGKDYDKFSECGLIALPSEKIKAPGISGCKFIFECKVKAVYEMDIEKIVPEINERWYKDNNYHTIYTGVILNSKEIY
ncbi:MAG: flavin reductase family protein [Bacillota bacterium]|nr:flavin reductase family protein [Bacillota bacterium]